MWPNSYLTIHGHARKGCTSQAQSLHEERPFMLLQLSERLVWWFVVWWVFFLSQGQSKEAAVPIEMFLL